MRGQAKLANQEDKSSAGLQQGRDILDVVVLGFGIKALETC